MSPTPKGLSHDPYWWRAAPRSTEPPDTIPGTVDVAIVGSGLTGLSATLPLTRAGRSVAIFDKDPPGYGASTRNAGYAGRSLKHGFGEIMEKHGLDFAKQVYGELDAALGAVFETVENERIECSLARQGRYIMATSPRQYDELAREFELRYRHLGQPFEMVGRADQLNELASDIYFGGVVIDDLAGLHPGLYHQGLLDRATAAGAAICGRTEVTAIAREDSRFRLSTSRGDVTARDVLLATNGYTGPLMPWLQRRLIPFDAYMITTEPLSFNIVNATLPANRTYIDWNFNVDWVRRTPDGTRLIYGGLTGTRNPGLDVMAERLRRKLMRMLPELEGVGVGHIWTGRCAGTFDLYPHTGVEDGIHYAAGYCFAGVPMGTYLGIKAARRILGAKDASTVFADRPFPTVPFYHGNPWFVPFAMKVMSRHDNR